jgi:hypothetical protein
MLRIQELATELQQWAEKNDRSPAVTSVVRFTIAEMRDLLPFIDAEQRPTFEPILETASRVWGSDEPG